MKKILFFAILGLFLMGNTAFAGTGFDNNLYFGLQGNSDVSKLQELLTSEGVYSGPITGNFYSLTLKAVKDFQIKYSISPAAGYFGPLTRAKANELLSADITASDNQAIGELGSAPVAITEKTANDLMQEQISALLSQVSLLQSQLTAQQQTNTSIQALQSQVATQTETIQQQQQVLGAIQQNTAPTSTSQAVVLPVVEVPKVLFVIGRNDGDNPNLFVSSGLKPIAVGERVELNSYVKQGNNIINYQNNNGLFDIQVLTSDSSQNKTIGMNNGRQYVYVDGQKISSNSQYASFWYYPKTAGTHTVTFFSPSLNSTKSIDIVVQ